MSALLCGNRFGRDLTRVGGVRFDVDEAMKESLLKRLEDAERDTANAVNLLWDSSSVMSRFEDAGRISEEVAREVGLVGPAARASGLGRDVRTDFLKGVYRYSHVPMCTWSTGDVFARAYVRGPRQSGHAPPRRGARCGAASPARAVAQAAPGVGGRLQRV